MKLFPILLFFLPLAVHAQQITLYHWAPGTSFPTGNCVVGDMFFKEDAPAAGQLYIAISTNCDWSQQGGNVRTEGTDTSLGGSALQAQALNLQAANVAIGFRALQKNTTAADQTAIGAFSLQSSIDNGGNTAVGTASLSLLTIGSDNVCVGYQCMQNATNTSSSTGVGAAALLSLTTGIQNNAFGASSLLNTTTGSGNLAAGWSAGTSNIDGISNVSLGNFALNDNLHNSDNVAVGNNALARTTGGFNTSMGYNSGVTATPANANVTGQFNSYFGYNAGPGAPNLSAAVAIGESAIVNCSFCMALGGMGAEAVKVGIGTANPTSPLQVVGLPVYLDNAAALAGGLTAGALYRTGADPDPLMVVH